MERRSHPRFPANCPIRLTVLTGEDLAIDAQLEEVSGSGARIASPVALAPGTTLRLDLPDMLLLGECVHCQPSSEGFTLGIHLEHSLGNIGELRRLMSALNREQEAQPPAPAVSSLP